MQIQKKRRHLPIRKLISQAGRAVQAIKPVFMMSPISVAQYLEPGAIEFDLLLIDEASQVQPVDALGAVERQVSRALAAHGCQTCPQVGVAGFFIDLAVVDPSHPGRYLLGIECDGANYHRSRSARDRDRLRSAVLEDRGWILHRIWSTDWFHRPEEELRKTFAAIEAAKAVWASRAGRHRTGE